MAAQIGRAAQIQKSETNELRSANQRRFRYAQVLEYRLLETARAGRLAPLSATAGLQRTIEEGRLAVPRLETDHPIAISSNDTKFPRGSKNDNSIALRFNRKLYQFLGSKEHIRVLDLGWRAAGSCDRCIDDGHFAVGLDGSDYPYVNQVAEWPTIPLHLFTCDITKPFRLTDRCDGRTALVRRHHRLGGDGAYSGRRTCRASSRTWTGIWPRAAALSFRSRHFSIGIPATGCVWHVTVKPRSWWEESVRQPGLRDRRLSIPSARTTGCAARASAG